MAQRDTTHGRLIEKFKASQNAARPFFDVMAECDSFYSGENNLLRKADGSIVTLQSLPVVPGWRNRYKYNQVTTRCDREVSAYTALFPAFEVEPAPPAGSVSADVASQSATTAAMAGERLLSHFYDELHLPDVDAELKRGCVVLGEMYAWPDYDPSKGKRLPGTGENGHPEKRTGGVAIRILDPTQVVWEQGKSFEESKWHAVQCFYTKQEASERWPEVWPTPDDVKPDSVAQATLSGAILDNGRTMRTPNLVSVWEYLERPSVKTPRGRYLCLHVNYTLEEDDYPYFFDETNDEPWIVRFVYRKQPRRSRAQSFMAPMLDPQRAIDRRHQIESEFANMAIPMWNVPRSMEQQQEVKIEPGAKNYTTPGLDNGLAPVPLPQPPQGLLDAPQRLSGELDSISGQYDPTNLASSAAAASIQQIVQQNQARQGTVARGFETAWARLGRRLLLLSRKNYTEPRSIKFISKTGPNTQDGFIASEELPGQLNVKVGTKTPRAPGEVQATATQWATLPNFNLSPARVMLAVQNNDLDEITGPFVLDKQRQERRNQAIYNLNPQTIAPLIAGFSGIMAKMAAEMEAQGVPFDPSLISPPPGPWPHADPHDNEDICMAVLTDWMKTVEYEQMPRENQQVAQWLLQELTMQKAAKETQQMQQQSILAQSQGAANASLPNQGTQMASQSSLQSNTPDPVNSQQAAPAAA